MHLALTRRMFGEPPVCRRRTTNRRQLCVGSWSWGALAASFGRFEVAMEVVGPPELAEAFAVQAERFAAASSSAKMSRRGS